MTRIRKTRTRVLCPRASVLAFIFAVSGACSGGDGGDDSPPDAMSPPQIDASLIDAEPSCLASNGWPASTLPADYQGTGYGVGDRLILPESMPDQGGQYFEFGQYYGAMLLIHIGGMHSPDSQELADSRRDREAEFDMNEYVYREISVLIDDTMPGADENGGYASINDAASWASRYSVSGPILADIEAYQFGVDMNVATVPTLMILDPMFEIRSITTGFVAHEQIRTDVEAAWAAFSTDNPDFQFDFCEQDR